MDLLGPSIEQLFDRCDNRFSLKTVCMLAVQLIDRLEAFHSRGVLHRDLKPGNILIGRGEAVNDLFLIDFGLSKPFSPPRATQASQKSFVGTARFASISAHLGLELSYGDDLESLGYMLLYLAKGRLPWQGLLKEGRPDAHYTCIGRRKMGINLAELCEGLPPEFAEYLRHVRATPFDARPDYRHLGGLFRAVLRRECPGDDAFDWLPGSPASECGLSFDSSLAERTHSMVPSGPPSPQ
eukprot:EG_transcript_16999